MAQRDYLAVLKRDPTNKYALYDLGDISQITRQTVDADRYYRKAIGADPAFYPALFNLAVLTAPTSPAQAILLYRQAVASQPSAAAAHLNLGLLLRSSGEVAKGAAEISTAEQLDPALKGRAGPTPASATPLEQ